MLMNGVGPRIAHYRKLRKLSQQALAERCGWPTGQSRIGNYESGAREPSLNDLQRIAEALGAAVSDLISTPAPQAPGDNVTPFAIKGDLLKLPLISWVTAGEWCTAEDPYSVGDAEDWLYTPFDATYGDYLLTVRGDSMFVPDGSGYSDGEIIHVKPGIPWAHGSDVIARTPEGKATFKRLIETPEGRYLEALNPSWPDRIIKIPEGTVICGVVVGSWRARR